MVLFCRHKYYKNDEAIYKKNPEKISTIFEDMANLLFCLKEDNSMKDLERNKDKEARKECLKQYSRQKRFGVTVHFSHETEDNLITYIKSKVNIAEYLRTLIKKDMEANR